MALKTLFTALRKEKAEIGFGNMVAIANESAQIRDVMLEEMGDPLDEFKNEAIDDEDMEKFIESIPEDETEDIEAAVADALNMDDPVDPDDYIGDSAKKALEEACSMFPDTEEC